MNKCLTLSDIGVDQCCVISKLNSSGIMRKRLMDIGFVPGSLVRCFLSSPSGNPMAYLIKGSIIALRKCDSCLIEVDVL